MNKKWSENDLQLLRERYGETEVSELAEKLEKSVDSIYKMASLLNLESPGGRWPDCDINYLKENYPSADMETMEKELARTRLAIYGKAFSLGLERDRKYEGAWEPEDKELLKKLFKNTDNEILAEMLDKSVSAIRNKAVKLKLKKSGHFWPVGRERYVLENYGKVPMDEMTVHLKRTKWAIINKYRELMGLRKTNNKNVISKIEKKQPSS